MQFFQQKIELTDQQDMFYYMIVHVPADILAFMGDGPSWNSANYEVR